MLDDYVVRLVKPANEMVLDEDVATVTGDSGGGGKFDGGFIIFIDDGGL